MLLFAGCAAFGLTKMFLSNPLQPRASSVVGLSVDGLSVDGLSVDGLSVEGQSVEGQSGVPYQTTSRQGGGARLRVSVCADLKHDDQSLLVPHVPLRHVTSLALGRVDLATVGADGLEYAIELENIGESSLCKLRLLPSCGCSKAGLEADVLLPHATTTGRVRIHPRLAGAQSTKISIVAEAPALISGGHAASTADASRLVGEVNLSWIGVERFLIVMDEAPIASGRTDEGTALFFCNVLVWMDAAVGAKPPKLEAHVRDSAAWREALHSHSDWQLVVDAKGSCVAQWWGARIAFTMPANSDSIVRDLGREAQLGELLRLSAVGVPAQVFAYSANSETTRN